MRIKIMGVLEEFFHGFVAAVLAAFYAFVKQAKLWEKSRLKPESRRRGQK